MSTGIKVFAPASVANVACGYDILGFALEYPGDEIIGRLSSTPGLRITRISGIKHKIPFDVKKNTAGVAALKLLEHLDATGIGIELEIYKKMPSGSGMGSSAASAAAAVMVVNELLKRPLSKMELLPFAVQGEQVADGAWHADNVAPSLLGGMILVQSNDPLNCVRLYIPDGLHVAVVYPHIRILTREAREILSSSVSMDQLITQTANISGFITGLFRSDFELIARSLKDVVIEPQRSKLIPHFYEVQAAALSSGAYGCSISGAGPSIFALCANSLEAERSGREMQRIFKENDIPCELYLSKINQEGAKLL